MTNRDCLVFTTNAYESNLVYRVMANFFKSTLVRVNLHIYEEAS